MPIVLLILGALGLLAIGTGWLQNVTTDGAEQMHVDVFGWTLGPLSHGAWLLVASLLGMATMACLLGAFALFRRSGRTRGAATATTGASAARIREDATPAQGRDRDSTSRQRDTGRARERVTAEEKQVTASDEHLTTGGKHATTGGEDAGRDTTPAATGQVSAEESLTGAAQGDVRDNIPHSDKGRFSDMQDDMRNKASDAPSRATGDDEEQGGDLADQAKDAFGKARKRR